MIRHIVLIRFRSDVSDDRIAGFWARLDRLRALCPGIQDVVAGRSESPEQIERGYMHGFVVDFESWDALATYQSHPDHVALGADLVAAAEGGGDGLLVFDLPI